MKKWVRRIIAIIYLSRLWFVFYAEFHLQVWIYLYYFFNWLIIASLLFLARHILNAPIELNKKEIYQLSGELRRCGIFFVILLLCEIFYILIGQDLSSHPVITYGQLLLILCLISCDFYSRMRVR